MWSEFLTVPSPAYKAKPAADQARVLTSASFLQVLAEKERKKEEATKEKERRKKEREEKKALKEREKAAKTQKSRKASKKPSSTKLSCQQLSPQQLPFSGEEERLFKRRQDMTFQIHGTSCGYNSVLVEELLTLPKHRLVQESKSRLDWPN